MYTKNMEKHTKILVFADVHGNYNCLKQLEKTQDYKTSNMIVFLGDVVVGFSRPNECIEFLTKNNCKCLLGNNDSYVCDHIPQADLKEFSQDKIKQVEYMAKHLTKDNKKILKSWDKQLYLTFGKKTFYFTHYMWEQYNQDFNVVDFPQSKCFETRKQMFENICADYVFFGHEHNSVCYTDNNQYFYAVGTLGVRNPGHYAVIEIDGENVDVKFKTIEHNIEQEIQLAINAGYQIIKPKG